MKKTKLDPLTHLQLQAIREQIDVLLETARARSPKSRPKPPRRLAARAARVMVEVGPRPRLLRA